MRVAFHKTDFYVLWAAVWTAVVTAKKNPVANDQIMTNGVSPDILRAL